MAHFSSRLSELSVRMQKALGLEGKQLSSLDVCLHLAEDEIVKTKVTFVEFIDQDEQEAITRVYEWLAEQDHEWIAEQVKPEQRRHIAPEKCENESCTGRAALYVHIDDRWLCRLCFGIPEKKRIEVT